MNPALLATLRGSVLSLCLTGTALCQPLSRAAAAPAPPSFDDTVIPRSPISATEIASLSGSSCLRALIRARVPFERMRWPTSGMVTPVLITGPIAGVTVRASASRDIHETMDCLLALAIVRWSALLRARNVREVRHLSLHRAAHVSEALREASQRRHHGGLAIDASTFVLGDGTEYEVTRDFHGGLGEPVCGPTARLPVQPAARFLRRLFCDTARAGIFHVLLSPNFNEEHHNHFHLEVARSVSWIFMR